MKKYKILRHLYGIIPAVQLVPGQIVQFRPEDVEEYVKHGAMEEVKETRKIRTKEEKKTKQ